MTKTKPKTKAEPQDDGLPANPFTSLPVRWQIFLTEWVSNGHNATKAYSIAFPGTTPNTCAVNGSRLLSHAKMLPILREMAASRESVIVHAEKVCEDAMRARHVAATASGIVETELPDHAIRLKAVQTVAKLKGLNAPDRVEVDVMEDTWKELLG